jgi:hypothetical protein
MSFASSLLAFSLHSLAAQPEYSAHVGTEVAYANFFAAMGADKVSHNIRLISKTIKGQGNFGWRPDMVVDFGDFQVLVEISSHVSGGQMSMIQEEHGHRYESHHHKVKQALAYASKVDLNKPTVCIVTSHLEFVSFNPANFNLKAMTRHITTYPSQNDTKAANWVKKQKAFKVIKKQTVASLADYSKAEFISYLRTVAGLPPQEVRLVAE